MSKRQDRFLLGLAISALSLQFGQRRSRSELAAFTGVTRERIRQIEEGALRKLRRGPAAKIAKDYCLTPADRDRHATGQWVPHGFARHL